MGQISNNKSGQYAELPLRIASALVLAGFALFCTWMGGDTFRLLAVVLSVIIFAEFRSLVKAMLPNRVAITAFGFLFLLIGAYFAGRPETGLIIGAIGVMALGIWEWMIRRSVWGATALLYAGLPFVALTDMRAGANGLFIILFVFACVWGADTFAYFTGKTFGGPKLAPSISPNKTWSGFLGGFAGAILVSIVVDVGFGHAVTAGPILLAVILAFTSQIGDLFESWVKRRFGQKDSGRIIPGHGGLLDRIDGLIFAIATAWLLAIVIAGGLEADLSGAVTGLFFGAN